MDPSSPSLASILGQHLCLNKAVPGALGSGWWSSDSFKALARPVGEGCTIQNIAGFCFKPLRVTETDTHNLSVLKHSEVQIPPPAGEQRFGGSLLSRSVWASNLLTDRGSPISPAAQ